MTKFSFRQRWFPTRGDAKQIAEKWNQHNTIDYKVTEQAEFSCRWLRSLGLAATLVAGIYLPNKLNNVIIEDSVYQGQVVSFGREGIIWKTYEGSFAIGGENRSSTGSFSLDEQARNGENVEELAKQLYKAAETKADVRIHGTRPLFCWPWRSSLFGDYHVDRVEDIER